MLNTINVAKLLEFEPYPAHYLFGVVRITPLLAFTLFVYFASAVYGAINYLIARS